MNKFYLTHLHLNCPQTPCVVPRFLCTTCYVRAIFVWPWNENARTKQKQQTNGNRAIWLVYRTDTNVRGFWLVKRTLGWKNFTHEDFLEINRPFALTSHCNTIGQSNNAFSILRISLKSLYLDLFICWLTKQITNTWRNHFFKVIRKSLYQF